MHAAGLLGLCASQVLFSIVVLATGWPPRDQRRYCYVVGTLLGYGLSGPAYDTYNMWMDAGPDEH